MSRLLLAASLFLAAPLFSLSPSPVDPWIEKGELHWFQLTESKQDVTRLLGPPKLQADFGVEFTGWQYQIGEIGDEDFSHYLVFSKLSGSLVSVARNYDPEHNVDEFFPESATAGYTLAAPGSPVPFRVRVRRLPGEMFLLAMGISKPGEACGQIVLIRQSALRIFYPELAAKIQP